MRIIYEEAFERRAITRVNVPWRHDFLAAMGKPFKKRASPTFEKELRHE